jgi:hypothetical protein
VNRQRTSAEEWAIGELRDAEDCLYAAANELARKRSSDPAVAECAALAKQCDVVARVLEKRTKKRET